MYGVQKKVHMILTMPLICMNCDAHQLASDMSFR